jgi:hypothetical protein
MDAWRFLSAGGAAEHRLGIGASRTGGARSYLRSLVEAGAQALVLELVQWLQEVPDELLQRHAHRLSLVVFHEEVRFCRSNEGGS